MRLREAIKWTACLLLACCSALDGKISIQNEPATTITGQNCGFRVAEGVAFSPSGNCLAVAWAMDHAIALYKRIGDSGSQYQTEPACVIQNSQFLNFAHDLAFSPCGRYLAVASREVHKVVLFKMENSAECLLQSEPCCILETPSTYPSSVCFSPDGKFLAVCNRMGGRGITIHQVLEEGIEPSPCLEITEAKMLQYGLSAPHGIAFMPDSKSIAVVHKKFYKNKEAGEASALSIIDMHTSQPSYIDFYDNKVELHSVDCHPTGHYLVVVDEIKMVAFYAKDESSNQYSYSLDLPIKVQGSKAKGSRGAAFSADGKSLALTTREPSVTVYSVSVE